MYEYYSKKPISKEEADYHNNMHRMDAEWELKNPPYVRMMNGQYVHRDIMNAPRAKKINGNNQPSNNRMVVSRSEAIVVNGLHKIKAELEMNKPLYVKSGDLYVHRSIADRMKNDEVVGQQMELVIDVYMQNPVNKMKVGYNTFKDEMLDATISASRSKSATGSKSSSSKESSSNVECEAILNSSVVWQGKN